MDLNRLEMNQCLVEAVIASESSMVKKKVSDLQFQSRYRAIVIAVHRHGAQLNRLVSLMICETLNIILMLTHSLYLCLHLLNLCIHHNAHLFEGYLVRI